MPSRRVKGGWRWGAHGKLYGTKAEADRQGSAVYATGWREPSRRRKRKRR